MAVKVETKGIKANTGSLIFCKSWGGGAQNQPALLQGGGALSVTLLGTGKDNEVAVALRPTEGELEESHLLEALGAV